MGCESKPSVPLGVKEELTQPESASVATVYENAGAEYGSIGKDKLLAAEAKAKYVS